MLAAKDHFGRYGARMPGPEERLAVGWCHGCGVLQLRDEMPTEWLEWTETVESVCVSGDDEPWGVGVWEMGDHGTSCPSAARARAREVDWSPVLDECNCGGNAHRPRGRG